MNRETPDGNPLKRADYQKLASDERELASIGHVRPGGGARGGIVTDSLLGQATGRDDPKPRRHRHHPLRLPRVHIPWTALAFLVLVAVELYLINARQFVPAVAIVFGLLLLWIYDARKGKKKLEPKNDTSQESQGYGSFIDQPACFKKSGWYQLQLLLGGGLIGWLFIIASIVFAVVFPPLPLLVAGVMLFLLWLGIGPKSWKTWFLYKFRTKMFLTDEGFGFSVDPPIFWRQPDQGNFLEFEDLSGIDFKIPGGLLSQIFKFGLVIISSTGNEQYVTPVLRNATIAAGQLKKVKDNIDLRREVVVDQQRQTEQREFISQLAEAIVAAQELNRTKNES